MGDAESAGPRHALDVILRSIRVQHARKHNLNKSKMFKLCDNMLEVIERLEGMLHVGTAGIFEPESGGGEVALSTSVS